MSGGKFLCLEEDDADGDANTSWVLEGYEPIEITIEGKKAVKFDFRTIKGECFSLEVPLATIAKLELPFQVTAHDQTFKVSTSLMDTVKEAIHLFRPLESVQLKILVSKQGKMKFVLGESTVTSLKALRRIIKKLGGN